MKKQCFKCKVKKDISQFYVHKQMKGGYLGKCKTCTKNDVFERYNNPLVRLKIKEYERLRFQNPERKKKVYLYALKRRKLHIGKVRANQKVAWAIKSGKLVRQPCIECGENKSQAHHRDYRKPLDVVWLCFKHHREEHGQKVL